MSAPPVPRLRRVLFIDNDPNAPTHCLVIQAHNEGCIVDHSVSVEASFPKITSEEYDIILLGMLPDSADFVKTCRAMCNVPVVVMPKDNEMVLARRCIEAGAYSCFKKPVHSAVMDTIASLVWTWRVAGQDYSVRSASAALALEDLPRIDPDTATKWDLPVFDLDLPQMATCVLQMFNSLGLMDTLHVNPQALLRFVCQIAANYQNCPYHNFRHAFDVCQASFVLLQVGGGRTLLRPLEMFALLMGALLHDSDHPGVTNGFLCATHSHLALLHNDRSPLENHHAAIGWQVVLRSGILANFNPDQVRFLRSFLIESVLATDFAKHKDYLAKFQPISAPAAFDKDNADHRAVLVYILLKTADISNPTRPFDLARLWAHRIQEEFFLQGDKERALLMPSLPNFDRHNPGFSLSASQIGFGGLVGELVEMVKSLLPGTAFTYRHLQENLTTWRDPRYAHLPSGGEPF